LNTPILFLVFNRPDTTQQVFEVIREVKPAKLYIAADGPRLDKEGEKEKCEAVRKIVTQIDWDCESTTLFREENLGCGKAVSEAITWFFEQVEEGIILEDDCLPDISFFRFCEELLEKYRTDEQVMSISGSNLLSHSWKIENQSYFWGHGGIWGWATWKRAWNLYDIKMTGWNDDAIKNNIRIAIQSNNWYEYYYNMFEYSYNGTLNTWDIQWFYCILINVGLCINPEVNLVTNLGFGAESTHTESISNWVQKLYKGTMTFPLLHPKHRIIDIKQLEGMYKFVNEISTGYKENLFEKFYKKVNPFKIW
jgi:hypothetical protein